MGLFNKEYNKENKDQDNTAAITPQAPIAEKCLYLIDYENVSDAGLVGVDTLTADDQVVIFYGSKIKSVAYESLIAITESKAAIEHIKAEKTAKNYLDFQLTTYLGYKLGSECITKVFIISKDSGFDAVVDFWTSKGTTIARQSSVVIPEKEEVTSDEATPSKPKKSTTRRTGATKTRRPSTRANVTTKPRAQKTSAKASNPKDKTRAELRTALKGCGLTAPEYKKVYDAFDKCTSTSNYNNTLQKAFGNEKTSEIYKATGKIFEREHK